MSLKIVRVRSIAFCHFRVFVLVESFWRALSSCELCKSLARRNEYPSGVMDGNSAKSQIVFCLKPFLRYSSNLNYSIRSIKTSNWASECARGIFPKHVRMRIAILVQGCEKSPSTLNFSKISRTNYLQNFRKHKKDQDRLTQQKLSKSVS